MTSEVKKCKKRLARLSVLGFIFSTLPVVLCLIIKWNDYVSTVGEGVKLAFGAIFSLLCIAVMAIGKLRLPGGFVLFAFVFVISYLLEAVLRDMVLISFLAMVGAAVDSFLFSPLIKRERARLNIEKTADTTTRQVEAVLKKYTGGGRV